MNRRLALKLAGTTMAFAAWPSIGLGFGDASQVGIAVLDRGRSTTLRPRAIEQLMWEVSKRTSITVREAPISVKITDQDLFNHPLIVWFGDGAYTPLTEPERTRLSQFLRGGGTLIISDVSPKGDDVFDQQVRAEMKALWSDRDWLVLGNDHTLYRTFYLLENPVGRIRRSAQLEGVLFDDRSPVIYERNDLFGAFGREKLGGWLLPVFPGGDRQREMAFRTGINLVMYATCLNYKRDQVHVTEILRRRNWRVKPTRTMP
ncbi:MAG: DUF4159 domain-containing protein [Bradymonadia bacterium]